MLCRFRKIIFCQLILKTRLKSFIYALHRHNKYVKHNVEKNQGTIPYLKILCKSDIIGNTRNLKFVLQVEPEVVYTPTVRNIMSRDTDVHPNTPALIAGSGQKDESRCYIKYCGR